MASTSHRRTSRSSHALPSVVQPISTASRRILEYLDSRAATGRDRRSSIDYVSNRTVLVGFEIGPTFHSTMFHKDM